MQRVAESLVRCYNPGVLPKLKQALLAPLQMFGMVEHRIYWVHLLTAGLLAAGVWLLWMRKPRRRSLLGFLLPLRVLRSRSSVFDVQWLFLRSLVNPLLWWPLRLTAVQIALSEAGLLRRLFGAPPWESPEERSWVLAGFTVALFLCDDWTRYLLHKLFHRVPALWELHKVHHSAEVLTPLTLYRVHPIESTLNNLRGLVTLGAVTGLFVWAFPGRLRGWEIMGVDALGFVWSALGANLRHSMVWLTWTRPLEHVFLSPAQHQAHHGRAERYFDKNFGSALAIWDWLGGSLLITSGERPPPRLGLSRAERNHSQTNVLSGLFAPMRAALRVLIAPLSRRRARARRAEQAAPEH